MHRARLHSTRTTCADPVSFRYRAGGLLIALVEGMGTRKSRKLKVMKETLRQLTPDQLTGVQGGGGNANTNKCPPPEEYETELVVRTRRCAC